MKLTPFCERDGVTIFCGDCLEIMPQLKGPFDAIIADLPYGTTACAWDTIIPFEPLWKQYKRLTTGAVVLFGSQPFTSVLVMSNLKWFRYEWIWEKNRGSNFANTETCPMKEHENIIVFSGTTYTYNPQLERRSESGKARAAYTINPSNTGKRQAYDGIKTNAPRNINPEWRIPRSIQKFNTEVGLHPTQKPLALLTYLIRTYTNPDDIILDNTMGSGTTLVAARQLGRRCVGIELDESYCRIAVERLRQRSLWQIPTPMPAKPQAEQQVMRELQ